MAGSAKGVYDVRGISHTSQGGHIVTDHEKCPVTPLLLMRRGGVEGTDLV